GCSFRRDPTNAHLHELPFTGLGGCANACARPPKFSHSTAAALDARQPTTRLRFFQSQHSCAERNWVFHLPRPGEPDASNLEGALPLHAMVSGLPRSAGATDPPKGRNLRHEMEAAAGSTRARTQT